MMCLNNDVGAQPAISLAAHKLGRVYSVASCPHQLLLTIQS